MEEIGYKNYRNMGTLENILNYFKENMYFSKEQTVILSPATSILKILNIGGESLKN